MHLCQHRSKQLYPLHRCGLKRTAMSFTWMWSTSRPMNCPSASATSSSQSTPDTRTDRSERLQGAAHFTLTTLAACVWCDCVHRTTTASCRGSFWGSISFPLVWGVLMSPPVCPSMECLQSRCHGHLSARSAQFQFPVKTEQLNRKCRAVLLSFHY